ncbi:hypothetical protein WDU94_010404 [Cyamophila willieti]
MSLDYRTTNPKLLKRHNSRANPVEVPGIPAIETKPIVDTTTTTKPIVDTTTTTKPIVETTTTTKPTVDEKVTSKSIVDIPVNVPIPEWQDQNQTEEMHLVIEERRQSEANLIKNVAYRGDAKIDYQIGLRQMNLFMRQNYNKMIDRVGHNVYPLIVATDVDHDKRLSGTGSEYILFLRNGTIRHMKPTPAQYEQNKNLAHLPMSIFTIISPYFNNPTSPMWHDQLTQLRTIVNNNLILVSSLEEFHPELEPAIPFSTVPVPVWTSSKFCTDNLNVTDHKNMLTLVKDYIDNCLKEKRVDVEGYKNFTSKYLPFAEKALTCAAQIQAESGLIELNKWKKMLGKKAWRDLYVIIPVVWPVARLNPRQLIFEKLMDKDRVATRILKAEGSYSVEEARATAGRIIADRTMAHFVFGYQKENHVEMNMALSTRRDLLATTSLGVVNKTEINYSPYLSIILQNAEKGEDPEVEPNEINFQN